MCVLLCYCVTVLLCYCVTVLLCYCVTVLRCYCVTVLRCYGVTVLLCYCVTMLLCYYVTVLLLIGVFCNRVGLRWNVVGDMPVWLGNSVVECSHGQGNTLCSSPVEPPFFTCYMFYSKIEKYISCVTLFLAFCRFNCSQIPFSLMEDRPHQNNIRICINQQTIAIRIDNIE